MGITEWVTREEPERQAWGAEWAVITSRQAVTSQRGEK